MDYYLVHLEVKLQWLCGVWRYFPVTYWCATGMSCEVASNVIVASGILIWSLHW